MDERTPRYRVRLDTVVPRKGGGLITLKAGEVLDDSYYAQFAATGLLVRVDEQSAGADSPETPAFAEVSAEGAPVEPPRTREALELLTKVELQVLAPDAKGSKADLIEHILSSGSEDQRAEDV